MLTPAIVTSVTAPGRLSPHRRRSASRTRAQNRPSTNATRTRLHTASADTSRSYATELARAKVSVYTLKDLLGHKSIATTQRYVDAASVHMREAAAQNPLYNLLDRDN